MSFTDRLVLWLHIGVAIFTIGPVTVAIMASPRYIRAGNLPVLRYLHRTTRIFALISLLVLVFGIVLAQQLSLLGTPKMSVAITLFVVAIALLLLIMRDQRKAIGALQVAEAAAGAPAPAPGTTVAADSTDEARDAAEAAGQPEPVPATAPGTARHMASVERGRIATMGAVVSVIWLVILVLMVWH
ncbi:MAG TPA: hypothetical protein VGG25_05760 [Streptosporangiaceae bacterium]|jgi:hypothetical protein